MDALIAVVSVFGILILIGVSLYYTSKKEEERLQKEEEEDKEHRWKHFLKFPPVIEYFGKKRYLKIRAFYGGDILYVPVQEAMINRNRASGSKRGLEIDSEFSDEQIIALYIKKYERDIYNRLVSAGILKDDADSVSWFKHTKFNPVEHIPQEEDPISKLVDSDLSPEDYLKAYKVLTGKSL